MKRNVLDERENARCPRAAMRNLTKGNEWHAPGAESAGNWLLNLEIVGEALATSCSDATIKIVDGETLTTVANLVGHTSPVRDLSSGSESGDEFVSASGDGLIHVWDLRSRCVTQSFGPLRSTDRLRPILRDGDEENGGGGIKAKKRARVASANVVECGSADLSNDGVHIVAGHGRTIVLWDRRMTGGPLSGKLCEWGEAHSDAITKVRYHPDNRNIILTSSLDGLVCSFNTYLDLYDEDGNQEDPIDGVINIGSSVAGFGFFGSGSQSIWALSLTESLSLWEIPSCTALATLDNPREIVADHLGIESHQGMNLPYIVCCEYEKSCDQLWLITAERNVTPGQENKRAILSSVTSTGSLGRPAATALTGRQAIRGMRKLGSTWYSCDEGGCIASYV